MKGDMRRQRLSAFILASILGAPLIAQAADKQVTAEYLGLSDYRYFVIYPHLEKAMRAIKNNDKKVAITQFERIHHQVPDNIQLTLYLAEAYRHFGYNNKAQSLLQAQLKKSPGNRQLIQALAAIPVHAPKIDTLSELQAQQKRCDIQPDTRCRSEIGQSALRLEALNIAAQQLQHPDFAATDQGKLLQDNLLQRAIYLHQWSYADDIFARLYRQNQLTATQQQQWFTMLDQAHADDRILELQAKGLINTPRQQLNYAGSLAQRNETTRLRDYLTLRHPDFDTAEQEKGWIYLISRYSAEPNQDLARFSARFTENRQYLSGSALLDAIKAKDFLKARGILKTLPDDQWVNERLTVSLAEKNGRESVQLARQIYHQHPRDFALLDSLTYRLVQAGQKQAAQEMLLQAWPFQGAGARQSMLAQRLFTLLSDTQDTISPAMEALLETPLDTPALRALQASRHDTPEQCKKVFTLLGDLSPQYDANAWELLGRCYQRTLPGLALYAFQQSEIRTPNAYHHKNVAYQAYATGELQTALAAWDKIESSSMTDNDVMAAVATAQEANNSIRQAYWLGQAKDRGLIQRADYWWFHAQRFIPHQPVPAISDLNRAIALHPEAKYFAARANLWKQQGDQDKEIADLKAAISLEPHNALYQAALGYALWDAGDINASRDYLEQAHQANPDDPALIRQLAYVHQRRDDRMQALHYVEHAIDDIDRRAAPHPLNDDQREDRFNFMRLHEDIGRRWTFNFNSMVGLRSGAMSSANNNINRAQPGQSYRSYGQLDAEYRIGNNVLLDGDQLSAYGKLFAGTGESGTVLPVKSPIVAAGVRWKPLREQTFFLSAEQQFPLDHHNGESDVMLRASASFFNDGKYSDDWHPTGNGWLAQNLYFDAAHYIRQDDQSYTADYRVSWHQKANGYQTLEPYTHIQYNGYRDENFRTAELAGVGMRWNIWLGQTHYDAWPHKLSLGVEYQRTLHGANQNVGDKNNAFITIGVRW